MMTHTIRHLAFAAAAAVTLSACAGTNLGALGDILNGGGLGGTQQGGQVVAEVQSVDTQRQLLGVRAQDGSTGNVYFDQNTVVYYQQRQYPVTSLERGDVVALQLQQASNGSVYASRIDVQQSVQDRTGQTSGTVGAGLQQMSGRVGQIDVNNGLFELQTSNGTVVVSLPYNPSTLTEEQFRRLRTGNTVQIEGRALGNNRVELSRFL